MFVYKNFRYSVAIQNVRFKFLYDLYHANLLWNSDNWYIFVADFTFL